MTFLHLFTLKIEQSLKLTVLLMPLLSLCAENLLHGQTSSQIKESVVVSRSRLAVRISGATCQIANILRNLSWFFNIFASKSRHGRDS